MIKNIQAQEVKRQIEHGGIFNGRWNRLLYNNVKDELALQHIEDNMSFLSSGSFSPVEGEIRRTFKEDMVYDGFNARKQFKY